MKKFLILALIALILPSANAGDFILRSTDECCGSADGFPAGSRAMLIKSGTSVSETKLSTQSYLLFKDVDAGRYDMVLVAPDFIPIKFIDLNVGAGDTWDFELLTRIRSGNSSFLEGQLLIRFRKAYPDNVLSSRIKSLGLKAQQTSRLKESEEPEFEFLRTYDYTEVRVAYDRSEKIADVIERVLLDQAVIECTPVFFSN